MTRDTLQTGHLQSREEKEAVVKGGFLGGGAVWTREEAKAGWESSPLSDLCGDRPPRLVGTRGEWADSLRWPGIIGFWDTPLCGHRGLLEASGLAWPLGLCPS